MDSIIRLLPDNIANQIAAGEVIQRPASVVKELVENAVDAGATEIQIEIKDAGKTLIQVIDNGKGMAPMDARMAFERHATSKIRQPEDLFALTTLGFRGEALPSIAAVSHVTLQSRTADNEQGIRVELEGSKVISSTPVVCDQGANFAVRHLFFNTPARRKFLKRDETEYRHIINEVERVAAVRPQIRFILRHNELVTFDLPTASARQRLIDLYGKRLDQSLIPLQIDTPMALITGFVSKTTESRKRGAQQQFFVNERYMKHALFHRIVMNAYSGMIPAGEQPEYFIFFAVDPSSIDVNISPTKTEIKFADEKEISNILYSSLREVLMAKAAVPDLDFQRDPTIPLQKITTEEQLPEEPPIASETIVLKSKMSRISTPTVPTSAMQDPRYDPILNPDPFQMPDISDWDKFYEEFEAKQKSHSSTSPSTRLFTSKMNATLGGEEQGHTTPLEPHSTSPSSEAPAALPHLEAPREGVSIAQVFLYGPYALYETPQGLAIAHLRRVYLKVSFEQLFQRIQKGTALAHQLLFPTLIELGAKDAEYLRAHLADWSRLGFDISDMGHNDFTINALPEGIPAGGEEDLLLKLLQKHQELQHTTSTCRTLLQRAMVEEMAQYHVQATAHQQWSPEAAQQMLQELYTYPEYLRTPTGQQTITLLTPKELSKRFSS